VTRLTGRNARRRLREGAVLDATAGFLRGTAMASGNANLSQVP